jgi:transposase
MSEVNTEKVITVQQQKAITALLSERNKRDAAKTAGVSEKTLYTWLNEPAFRGALRDAEKAILDDVTRRLSAGQRLALDALAKLIQSARHESTKLRASVAWLELSLKFRDMQDIEERLTALEAALHEKQK